MGERKVLNKYIPPDFDPSKIPRGTRKGGKRNEMKVRMMLPMSICCNTCGNYIMKGTKFNSRKEDALGEDYLGIQIFRFFFRCNRCSAEITMKTDPQNSDYTVERGASRNYEPWRDKDSAGRRGGTRARGGGGRERHGGAGEQDQGEQARDGHHGRAGRDAVAQLAQRQGDAGLGPRSHQSSVESRAQTAEEAEEAQAKAVFAEAQKAAEGFVRRLESSSDDSDEDGKGKGLKGSGGGANKKPKTATAATGLFGGVFGGASAVVAKPKPKMVVVKAKPKPKPAAAPAAEEKKEDSDSGGGGGALAGLLGAYGSESPS